MENKNKYIVWIVLLALTSAMLVTFQGCSLFKKKYEKKETREFTYKLGEYKKLLVDNTNGSVTIRRSENEELITVKAEITKYVTKKELDEPLKGVSIEIDTVGNTLRVSDIKIKEKSNFRFELSFGHSTTINYVIYVPAGLEINVDGTNGSVDLRDFNNDVKVELTNGNLKIENVYGNIKADMTNGNINSRLDSAKNLDFETTNGNIKLEVGEKFSGTFEAKTTNGKIIRKNVTFSSVDEEKKDFKGTLGNGDAIIKLKTTNGRISIEQK